MSTWGQVGNAIPKKWLFESMEVLFYDDSNLPIPLLELFFRPSHQEIQRSHVCF